MSHRIDLLLSKMLALALSLAAIAVDAQHATATGSGSQAAQRFEVTAIQKKVPNGGIRHYCLITGETNKFSFTVPSAFKVYNDQKKTAAVLVMPEGFSRISIQVTEHLQPQEPRSVEAIRSEVLREHPNAEIIEEFAAAVPDNEAPAFDLKWTANTIVRVVCLHYPTADVKFSAIIPGSETARAAACYDALNDCIFSFRRNSIGENWEMPAILPIE